MIKSKKVINQKKVNCKVKWCKPSLTRIDFYSTSNKPYTLSPEGYTRPQNPTWVRLIGPS